MISPSGSFPYIDILPEKQTGKTIIVAPGSPITFSEMKRLLYYLYKNNRRVVCPEHPAYGFFESPIEKRPEILLTLMKAYKRAHLLAHSHGGIDTITMVAKWLNEGMPKNAVKGIILVNSPGIRKPVSLYKHYKNSRLFLSSAQTQEEAVFLKKWEKSCYDYPKIRLIKEMFDITGMDLNPAIQKIRNTGINLVIIQSNDLLLYPDGIDHPDVTADIKIENGGDHNGILINPKKYCGPVVMNVISQFEKE